MLHYSIDTYAVIGHPVAHSKSPFIHDEFAKQTGQTLQYLKIEAPLDRFAATVQDFQKRGGKGLNVTVPFKLQAYQFVTQSSPRAKQAQAVNTILIMDTGKTQGDNTDGVGLIRDITINHHYSLHNKKILILGAGGAVQGILGPLLSEQPQRIFIANRTSEKAQQLAARFSILGAITGGGFTELSGHSFDLIINGTSASLTTELLPLPREIISSHTFCYDMVFADKPTVFLQWATQQGAAHCSDGIGMLVEQAAESFYLWRGIRPQTHSVLKLLKTGRI